MALALRRLGALLLFGGTLALVLFVSGAARLERADLVMNNGAEVTTLDPTVVSGIPEAHVMVALYEGLTVRDPKTLEPLPGMAESWAVSEDGLSYTFRIRADARWSNGDPLTAHDFEWSWKRLLLPETASEYVYQLWYAKNARAFTLMEDDTEREAFWSEVGIRAEDDRTFVVELESPTPFFLHLVSFHPTFPTHRATYEWARETYTGSWQSEWVRPGTLVTNGPYTLVERRINDRIRLAKNPLYWDADNVALRTIDILAIEHYATMLNMYLTGEIDWIERVSPSFIPRLLPREDFAPQPYLGSYFYRVNVNRPPMDDVRVRRALALTIDRRAICEKVTKRGEIPSWSLSPTGLADYPRPEMRHTALAPDLANYAEAFATDCAEAKHLLSEAGYGPDGATFPTIEIHYNTAETHRDVAEVVADSWKRILGIDAKLLNQEWKVYLDTQNTINYDVSRSSWIGDYPDPNTFVDLFVTDGENNRTGWSDPRYDELVAAAAREPDSTRRLELLAQAEALLLEELPILPIYGYVSQNLVNPRVGGFYENIQDEHSWKFLYLMDDHELAVKRAAQPREWQRVAAPGPSAGVYPPNQRKERAR